MRLIDADKFEAFVIRTNGDEEFVNGVQYVLEKIDNTPTVEAIPKTDFEARLKADMVAILEDLKKEMNPIKECEHQIYGKEEWNFVGRCQDAVQQKINLLKENING